MDKKEIRNKYFAKTFTWEGKRIYCYGKTEAEAIEARAIRRKELEDGKRKISKHMACQDWRTEYMKVYRKPAISEKSYKDELSLWRVHIGDEIGRYILSQIKPIHCQSVLNKMATIGRREQHIKKARIFMKALFRAAIENGLLVENPAENLKIPACEEDGTHRSIAGMERAALLAACSVRPYPHGLWVKLMLYCGLRPDETSRVRGRHIDIKNARLYIDGTKSKAAKRYVPIPAVFAEELSVHASRKFDLILVNTYGGAINKTNRKRMWEQIKKEMHIHMGGKTDYGDLRRIMPPYLVPKDLVPYCLRHTYCTDLQDKGVPINIARDFMGHTSIEMTARIYTHMTDRSFEVARELIDKPYSL